MFRLKQTVTRPSGQKVHVLSAAILRSEQSENFEFFYPVPYLEVIGPPGLFSVRNENRRACDFQDRRWLLDEVPEDHTNGPWWDSGLVRYIFKMEEY